MTVSSIEELFERVRAHAEQGQLVIVREDGQFLLLPALARSSVNPSLVDGVEKMLPSTTKRKVAVIGDTSWASKAAPSIHAANQAIPFFGMLMGITCIDHSVWVFDGAVNLLTAGCRGADVLIVDSTLVATLPGNWQTDAEAVMCNPQILIHDRATYKLRPPGMPTSPLS